MLGEVLSATAVVTYLDAPPVLAFTGVESYRLLIAALLAVAAGLGLNAVGAKRAFARKED